MTIKYFGKNLDEDRKYPEAQIWYDENNKKAEEKMNKLIEILENMGWKCINEYGITYITLYNGKYEYEELVSDYKEAKKKIKEGQ